MLPPLLFLSIVCSQSLILFINFNNPLVIVVGDGGQPWILQSIGITLLTPPLIAQSPQATTSFFLRKGEISLLLHQAMFETIWGT